MPLRLLSTPLPLLSRPSPNGRLRSIRWPAITSGASRIFDERRIVTAVAIDVGICLAEGRFIHSIAICIDERFAIENRSALIFIAAVWLPTDVDIAVFSEFRCLASAAHSIPGL